MNQKNSSSYMSSCLAVDLFHLSLSIINLSTKFVIIHFIHCYPLVSIIPIFFLLFFACCAKVTLKSTPNCNYTWLRVNSLWRKKKKAIITGYNWRNVFIMRVLLSWCIKVAMKMIVAVFCSWFKGFCLWFLIFWSPFFQALTFPVRHWSLRNFNKDRRVYRLNYWLLRNTVLAPTHACNLIFYRNISWPCLWLNSSKFYILKMVFQFFRCNHTKLFPTSLLTYWHKSRNDEMTYTVSSKSPPMNEG